MALVGHISGSTQSSSVIGISGSVIVANRPGISFPAMPGTDVSFFVSGSRNGTSRSLFGGDVLASSSFNLKSGTGGISQFSVDSTKMSISTLLGTETFAVAASTGDATLAGDIAVNGGDITTTAATMNLVNAATTVNLGSTAVTRAINIGTNATNVQTIGIGTGNAANAISIGSNAASQVSVNGGDSLNLYADGGTITIDAGGAGSNTINVGTFGYAQTLSVGNTTGATSLTFRAGSGGITFETNATASANLTVTGDLTVNGSMVTVNTTNLEVKDSVIGLGFASGTLRQTAGDRGWIGGQAGTNNVMSKWDNTAAEFAFATTTSSATGSFAITAYSNLHANNIQGNIVSASLGFSGSLTKLMDGTSYIIAGSGMTITSASNGAITLAASGAGDVTGPASATANAIALFNGTTGKTIKNSGLTTDGSNSLFIGGTLGVSGSTTFGASALPSADMTYDLGSSSFRWANIHTGDLHLRNDRGDYTLIEEENFLTIRFNKTGKRYKFLLENTPEFDEDPKLNF